MCSQARGNFWLKKIYVRTQTSPSKFKSLLYGRYPRSADSTRWRLPGGDSYLYMMMSEKASQKRQLWAVLHTRQVFIRWAVRGEGRNVGKERKSIARLRHTYGQSLGCERRPGEKSIQVWDDSQISGLSIPAQMVTETENIRGCFITRNCLL